MGSVSDGPAVIIPARLRSTRLPRKLLQSAAGRTVLEWTWLRANQAETIAGVWIATDSDEIAAEAQRFGAQVLRTGDQPSGTDRVAAAAQQIQPRPDRVINLQGDEALLDPAVITTLSRRLQATTTEIITCATTFASAQEWRDPDVVKVVCTADGRAVYFSRAPIPGAPGRRDANAGGGVPPLAGKHIGIYGYPLALLEQWVALSPSPLEQAESLEQLRGLEAGLTIRVVPVEPGGPAVDTAKDLRRVQEILEAG